VDDEVSLRLVPPVRAILRTSRRSPAEPTMETLVTIIGVLTVAGWVVDQTLGDLRALLRSERRRRR
jgi:hypothetical protein